MTTVQTGWTHQQAEVRQALLSQLWIHAFNHYNDEENPSKLDEFKSEHKDSVTDEELTQLYAAMWGIAVRYWSLESRPMLYRRREGLCTQWSLQDFDAVIETINAFDVQS